MKASRPRRASGPVELLADEEQEGYGLTTVEYAYLAEEMGWSRLAPETFNCAAPDTGNMEVLERYGSPEHKRVAEASARGQDPLRLRDDGAGRRLLGCHEHRPGCQARRQRVGAQRREVVGLRRRRPALQDLHRHGLHRPKAEKHKRHSQILVPAGTKGVEILRGMKVYGDDDAPHGHMHIKFTNVRVPKENLISASAAASRCRRAGWGRAASTTACAPSASRSGRWKHCAAARCRARRSASRWPSSAPTTTSSPRAA